ncbi:hypothetical protein [uncultured Hymenobacter sp.]|uniref:hypothetical protein n=1 Tax=uncultured Hymenobacter sp. TaxID=170016 RepID=UPI0035CBA093
MKLGPLTLENPVCLGSAPWELAAGRAGAGRPGALFTKTVTMEPLPGDVSDHVICRVGEQSLLNRIGLRNSGAEWFVETGLPALAALGLPVVASVAAPGVPGFRKLARFLAQRAEGRLAGIELSVATAVPPGAAGLTADFVREATAAVRQEMGASVAVLVKLPAWPDHIAALGRGAQAGGADALTAVSPLKALHLAHDDHHAAPVLGGLSGQALRPVALRCVYELTSDPEIHLLVLGAGGIFSADHVADYLRVGAAAVQVASGEWLEPGLTARLAAEFAPVPG